MSEGNSSTRSIERALDILECFMFGGIELSLMEISNKINLSPSTAHRLIGTLQKRGYLQRNPINKKYHLGTSIVQLGNISINILKKEFTQVAFPYMVKLRDEFNESVTMYVRNNNKRVCVQRVESRQSLRLVMNIGSILPLEKGAPGKVLLAALPDEKINVLLEDYSETLKRSLQEVRKNKYAISRGEREKGLGAIAVPVFFVNGEVIAALSMTGPINRLLNKDLKLKVKAVIKCAAEISTALGYVKVKDVQ
ncbi:MAG TPA: IclR family transcriptional regulator [Clostridium sp.]|jgi:DNA-binding IclR family transcriptional regulator|uniref:IclR family transcriptional regulator n=1 Tax=Clostridium lapidicellarium TaxID=3240931 RepID=A0ABV4E1J9_9CLOT|nr:IclR family transcriptional regulator [Clostridium sp.]